jgi:hypothetical protein
MKFSIPVLEMQLEDATRYIEASFVSPKFVNEERLGYCKALIEYLPRLITILKIEEKRNASIQNDDLWQEIDRLQNRIAELEASKLDLTDIFPTEIKDTHYHKPDHRLVGGDPW